MNYANLLAAKYAHFNYGQLTPGAIQKTKECIIDYLGCTYAGYSLSSSKIVREFALGNYAQGHCTLIGDKRRLAPAGAGFVNGATGHGWELDDISKTAILHVGVVVIPVALAMAEDLGMSGRDVLVATTVGYDLTIKVGKSANSQVQLNRGFHPTSTCGVFGAAITAAKLLGLNAVQTGNALGIAGSFASGNLECYSDGSHTKRLQPGIAASSGISAACLAAKGYSGPTSIFEGPRGFFHAYSKDCRPEALVQTNNLEIEHITLKAHASCGFNQSPIDAVLEIRSRTKLDHKKISSILIELTKPAYDIVGQPAEIKYHPKSTTDGQFSAPYSVAIACIEGRAFLEEYSQTSIQRPDVQALMRKINVKHSADLDALLPEAFPARVTLVMNDKTQYSHKICHAKGDPQNPLGWQEVLNKFDRLTPSSMINDSRKSRIIETVEILEKIEDIKKFTNLLR